MKNIDSFQIFESYSKFKNYSNYYKYTGSNPQPGYQDFIYNFFKGMKDRFEGFNDYYKREMALRTPSGTLIDTGLGWLVKTAGSLGSTVAMKIFEPQDKKPFSKIEKDPNEPDNSWWARKKEVDPKDKEWLVKRTEAEKRLGSIKTDADVTAEHQRLFNSDFVKNDLPTIKNDEDMKKYIFDFYKKAGVPPGKNKVADEAASTIVTSYYNKRSGVNPSYEL